VRRSTAWSGLISSVLFVAACGGSAREAAPTPAPFAYDRAQQLRFEDRGRVNQAAYSLAVRDVSFTSGGDRVRAYLVVPPGRRRLPAAVYLHGSGGDRVQLLAHASWLAARGASTLAITAPSRTARSPAGLTGLAALRHQREIATRDVIAVRRALDLLESLRRVVPSAALAALARAAPRGATVRWYAAGHDLDVPALRDQLAWLSRRLAILGPSVPGARTSP